MKSAAYKTFFELTVLYAYDFEKRAAIFPKLKFKQSLEYARQRIADYIQNNATLGVFRPQISMRSIIMFVNSSIDGIAQSIAIDAAEKRNRNSEHALEVSEMFRTLAKVVIGLLEVNK